MKPLALLLLLGLSFIPAARAEAWPDHYIVAEGGTSPDDRYGILWLEKAYALDHDGPEVDRALHTNYLVDLKTKKVISAFTCSSVFQGANHNTLQTIWADDDSWCFAIYQNKWSFNSIHLLQLTPQGGLKRSIDIGKRILAAAGHTGLDYGYYGAHATGNGRLEIGATGTTEPKFFIGGNPLDEERQKKIVSMNFAGVLDLATGKWLSARSRPLSSQDYRTISGGLDAAWETTSLVPGDLGPSKSRTALLETYLNDVYAALKILYPPTRFEALKQEQLQWLKTRGEPGNRAGHEKTRDRIRALGERANAV
ncbi:MAG: hypothetical protein JWO82_3940 [Akkermansiaceae bacterium]|nr:hypothetical protein [Akkermansiaceae bacterium]